MTAVEEQGRLLSDLAQRSKNGLQQRSTRPSHTSLVDEDDMEAISRKDTAWTPITGSDMILRWSVFPRDKLVSTFPAAAYAKKMKPSLSGMCSTSVKI